MSWVLKIQRNKKKICAFIVVACLLLVSFLVNVYLGIAYTICACILILNEVVYRKNRRQVRVFSPASKTRNVDYLVIGDMCDADKVVLKGKTYVQLSAPNRTLKSAYEIARHTFSILDEREANLVFVVKKQNLNGGYSHFDYPIFQLSPISMKRLGLEKAQKVQRLNYLLHPIQSIQFMLNIKITSINEINEIPQELAMFCKERNIRIRMYTD